MNEQPSAVDSSRADSIPASTTEIVRVGGKLAAGTGRVPGSGRKPGTKTKLEGALSVAARLGFNAVETMVNVIKTGQLLLQDGRVLEIKDEEILKLLREVAPYLHSKAPTAVVAKHDHRHIHADLSHIMSDPALAAAAETLALAMSEQPDSSIAEGEFEDVTPEE